MLGLWVWDRTTGGRLKAAGEQASVTKSLCSFGLPLTLMCLLHGQPDLMEDKAKRVFSWVVSMLTAWLCDF